MSLLRDLESGQQRSEQNCRKKFDSYELKAANRCGNSLYKSENETRRIQRRMKQAGERSASDAMETMTAKEKFKINTLNVIINLLNCVLNKTY